MPICPRGHESQAEDWCDFCGFPMTPPAPAPGAHAGYPGAPGTGHAPAGHTQHGGASFGAPPPPPAPPGAVPPGAVPPPPTGAYPFPGSYPPPGTVPPPAAPPGLTEGLAVCPICRSPQTGRFCEECGYDYELSTPSRRQAPAVGVPGPGPAQPPPPLNIPASCGGAAIPQQPQPPAHPHTYGYPPSLPAGGQEGLTPEGAFPEAPVREDSGPVYAQPVGPGPNTRGGDFGTSFHLAPPQSQSQHQPEAAPVEPVRPNWIAVVSADRDYFTEMMARSGPEAAGLFFPPYCPERRIPLTGRGQLRIGRRSQHRGTVPEIDLSVPPEDPGASHQHALLAEQADGSWVLVDQDSTNGTTVNGGAEPIAPHTAVPLNDGDRIHIGAWTTITVHRA
ncbi:FHA domain-containing protein [Streptomyces sp. FH025]|uniref:FHA domain-containing protein n=1 Tax=Streptomyces sp. FH025 TaxID=2815937 RepID=UPI001A9D300C|nr:FHA domain-containing protein [Streptomyces sp. FH025]MBO1416151.1 FHA domain-containing protein [Streptomyces sp. FH025]